MKIRAIDTSEFLTLQLNLESYNFRLKGEIRHPGYVLICHGSCIIGREIHIRVVCPSQQGSLKNQCLISQENDPQIHNIW